jgi:hypothetical protein
MAMILERTANNSTVRGADETSLTNAGEMIVFMMVHFFRVVLFHRLGFVVLTKEVKNNCTVNKKNKKFQSCFFTADKI